MSHLSQIFFKARNYVIFKNVCEFLTSWHKGSNFNREIFIVQTYDLDLYPRIFDFVNRRFFYLMSNFLSSTELCNFRKMYVKFLLLDTKHRVLIAKFRLFKLEILTFTREFFVSWTEDFPFNLKFSFKHESMWISKTVCESLTSRHKASNINCEIFFNFYFYMRMCGIQTDFDKSC